MNTATDIRSAYQGGGSLSIKDPYLCAQLKAIRPETVVDFGAGAGKMGALVRDVLSADVHVVGVEGCASTVEGLRTKGVYDEIDHALLQDWISRNTRKFDLAIFGDVLEHVTRREAFRALNRTLAFARHTIVNVPLRNLQQDGPACNPLEEHRAYLFERDFDRRYLIHEKHLVTADPGYVILNVWITGQRHWSVKGRVKDCLLATLGRRGKRLLERLGYDAYPRADT